MPLKVLSRVAAVALLAVTAAACTSSPGPSANSSATGSPVRGGTLHVVRSESFDGWDQDKAAAYASYQTLLAVLEPLVRFNANGKDIEPGIATSWTYDAKALTWTFTLHDGVQFSDGSPLTSADVAFSESVWAAGPNFGGLYSGIKKVLTPDPKTAVFQMSAPNTTLPVQMSWASSGIIPKNYGGRTKAAFDAAPIGAGAFTVVSWSPSGRIVLARNPHYYVAGRPYLDKVQIDVVSDANERAVQFQSGQYDISEGVSTNTAKQYGASLIALPASQVEHLSLNVTKAPFDNPKVRQAIAAAIDYKGIAGGPYQGYASAPAGILPPNVGHYAPPSLPAPALDLPKARALLAGSGANTTGTYEVIYDSGQPNDALLAQILQQNLAAIGIKLKLTGLETGAFVGEAFGVKSDMVLWSYGAISPDMFDPIGWILGTSWLFTGDDTKRLKAEYDAYNAAQSDAAKLTIVTQIQDENLQTGQALPLASFQVLQGVSSKVRGFASAPWGMYYWDPIWLQG